MADRPRARRNDGVTIAPGTSPGKSVVLLAAAVVLACVALLVLFGRPPRPAPATAPSPPESHAPVVAAEPMDEPTAPAPEPPGAKARGEPARPAPRAEAAGPKPTPGAEAVPEDESAPTLLPSGIGLFPPPGTDPIKIGIVVPDDFELPEGFLRHYQVLDDGRDLPPILLFHPDYEVKGPDGKPIPLPADRVVPPALAPPGLPIVPLVVPEPIEEEGP